MATTRKRFTISLTPELEKGLLKLKKDEFYNSTQSEMVRYLIGLGLKANNHIKTTKLGEVKNV